MKSSPQSVNSNHTPACQDKRGFKTAGTDRQDAGPTTDLNATRKSGAPQHDAARGQIVARIQLYGVELTQTLSGNLQAFQPGYFQMTDWKACLTLTVHPGATECFPSSSFSFLTRRAVRASEPPELMFGFVFFLFWRMSWIVFVAWLLCRS